MRVAIVGAGGVGGYFGGKLATTGADVTFIVRGTTLDALRRDGLRVESINGDFVVQPVQAAEGAAAPVDVVLVATKAWQLREAARQILPMLHDTTVVVPLQNGIDAPDQLASVLPRRNIAGGLCAIVAYAETPGFIKHVGAEPLIMFGELDNSPSPRLDRLRDLFVAAGVKCEIPADIHHSMWTKFIFIAPLSGIGAMTRVPVGSWRTLPETRAMAEQAVNEVIAVARAKGVAIEDDVLSRTMARYDGLPPTATASLQRDVMDGKPSELDAQLGAVVRLGREAGVPTPLHEWMYHSLLPGEKRVRGGV